MKALAIAGGGFVLFILIIVVVVSVSDFSYSLPPPQSSNALNIAQIILDHTVGCSNATFSCYDSMPSNITNYWNQICPSTSDCNNDWKSGSFTGDMLVRAAYGLTGQAIAVSGPVSTWIDQLKNNQFGWKAFNLNTSSWGYPHPGDIFYWDRTATTPAFVAIAMNYTFPGGAPDATPTPGTIVPPATIEIATVGKPFKTITFPASYQSLSPPQPLGSPSYVIRYIPLGTFPVISHSPANKTDYLQFVCTVFPYIELARRYLKENNIQPWHEAVMASQWGIEQAWTMPDGITGYNWGNVSAIDNYPIAGSDPVGGAPTNFAYAYTAEQGAQEYASLIIGAGNTYASVTNSYKNGIIAQATALQDSPWDANHYGYSSVVFWINHLGLTDNPPSICPNAGLTPTPTP